MRAGKKGKSKFGKVLKLDSEVGFLKKTALYLAIFLTLAPISTLIAHPKKSNFFRHSEVGSEVGFAKNREIT